MKEIKKDWFIQTIEEIIRNSNIDPNDSEKTEALVSRLINETLPKASSMLLENLKSSSSEMLEEHRSIRQEFEARLLRKWSKAINLLEMLTVISLESAEMFHKEYRNKVFEKEDIVFEALIRIHARACQTTYEILHLLRGGFADGAFARWRTLYELSLISFFIKKHGNTTAMRYLDYEYVENYYEMLEYQRHCNILNYPPLTSDEVKLITKKKNELIKKYGEDFNKLNGWTMGILPKNKRNLKGIEEDIKLTHLRPFYKLACNNIHPGPKGNNFRLGSFKRFTESGVLLCGASNYGLADPGQNASISLAQITTCLLTIECSFDRLTTLQAIWKLNKEICNTFVEIQKEIENEEIEEQKD